MADENKDNNVISKVKQKLEDRKTNRKEKDERLHGQDVRDEISALGGNAQYQEREQRTIDNPFQEGTRDYSEFSASTEPVYNALLRAKQSVSEEYRPQIQEAPEIDTDEAIKLKRQEKNRRWMDIPMALRAFNRGQKMDWNNTPSAIAKQRRQALYAPYTETISKNQKLKEAWDLKEAERKMDVYDDAYKTAVKAHKSPEELEILKNEVELSKQRVEKIKQDKAIAGQKARDASKTKAPTSRTKVIDILGKTAAQIAIDKATELGVRDPEKKAGTVSNLAYDTILQELQELAGEDGKISQRAVNKYIKSYQTSKQLKPLKDDMEGLMSDLDMLSDKRSDHNKRVALVEQINEKARQISEITGDEYEPIDTPEKAKSFLDKVGEGFSSINKGYKEVKDASKEITPQQATGIKTTDVATGVKEAETKKEKQITESPKTVDEWFFGAK